VIKVGKLYFFSIVKNKRGWESLFDIVKSSTRYLYQNHTTIDSPTPICMIASKFVYVPRHARWTNTAPDMAFVRVDHIVHTATLRSDIRGKHGPAPVSAWPIARESGQFPASWSDCHFTTRVSVIVQSPAFRPERVYPPKPSVVAQPNRCAYGPYPSTIP